LPYLHQAMRALGLQGLQVTLMDGDLISETNCVRQPFSRGEVGLHKSIVMASRLNQFWGLNWDAAPEYLTDKSKLNFDIVVGCVDTRNARMVILLADNVKLQMMAVESRGVTVITNPKLQVM
jgi:tRNA A37 threonylcarbamoyladenosine dehydratase